MDLLTIIGKKVAVEFNNIDEAFMFYQYCYKNGINILSVTYNNIEDHIKLFGNIIFSISKSKFLEYGSSNFYQFNEFEIIKIKEIK